MLSLLYVGVEAQQYFVSSTCMFLDKKTLLQIVLNPGLRTAGPSCRVLNIAVGKSGDSRLFAVNVFKCKTK